MHQLEQMSHQELYSYRIRSWREVLEGRVSIREYSLRKVLLSSLVVSLPLCLATMKDAQSQATISVLRTDCRAHLMLRLLPPHLGA